MFHIHQYPNILQKKNVDDLQLPSSRVMEICGTVAVYQHLCESNGGGDNSGIAGFDLVLN